MYTHPNGVVTFLAPPEGYVVDFDNPPRTGVPDCWFIAGFGIGLAVLFLAQRIYTKVVLGGGLGWDDFFLFLAVVLQYASMGFTIHMFAHGLGGVHIWELPIDKYIKYLIDVYPSAWLYNASTAMIKISLLIFYLRLSPQKWFRVAIWVTIAVITMYTLGICIPLIFSCKPISMNWDPYITEGTCLNRPTLYILTAATNIISDLILFVLPIPMVIKLQIPTRQKIGLVGIFGVGSLTVITSIVRVAILPQLLTNPDATWLVAQASIWTLVEGNLMTICASMPTLRKFLRHVAPKLIGESRYGSNKKSRSREYDKSQPASRTLVPLSQSRRDRNQYSQFDNEHGSGSGIGNDTFIMGPVRNGRKACSGGANNSGGEEGTSWGDSDSERAIIAETGSKTIVQTTTIRVDVEQADPPRKSATS